jgi:WD40 repeat protein
VPTQSGDNTVMLWTADGRHRGSLEGHRRAVRALASLPADGRMLLASGSDDQTIRIWDPEEQVCLATLTGHIDRVNTVCPVTADGRTMLASGSQDRTVKLWDVDSRSLLLSIPVHHPVLACLEVSGLLFVGLTAGSLALDVNASGNDLLTFREI